MEKTITAFVRDESGATVLEYAILASLIGAVAIAIIFLAGGEVKMMFDGSYSSINNATSS